LLKTEQIDAAVDLLGRQLREHRVKTNLGNVRSVIERIVKDDRLGFALVALEKNERPIAVALGCAFLGIEHDGTSGWIEDCTARFWWRNLFGSLPRWVGARLIWKSTPAIGAP